MRDAESTDIRQRPPLSLGRWISLHLQQNSTVSESTTGSKVIPFYHAYMQFTDAVGAICEPNERFFDTKEYEAKRFGNWLMEDTVNVKNHAFGASELGIVWPSHLASKGVQ